MALSRVNPHANACYCVHLPRSRQIELLHCAFKRRILFGLPDMGLRLLQHVSDILNSAQLSPIALPIALSFTAFGKSLIARKKLEALCKSEIVSRLSGNSSTVYPNTLDMMVAKLVKQSAQVREL